MTLKRLSLHNLRNISAADISPSATLNLFYGDNGSGKTTMLEAISILGLGRSFRSHKLKPLINYDSEELTVFGRLQGEGEDIPVGVMRSKSGQSAIKIRGEQVSSASVLAEHLPVQVINAQTFQLLEGSPKVRRQFIDWLVFHVEPSFFPAWKALQRCLKHRNSLLRRDRISPSELLPWDRELSALAERIHGLREESLKPFFEAFDSLAADFIHIDGLKLSYYRGWDKEQSYADILEKSIEADVRQGYTRMGSHRADLKISVHGQNAADILSRGQQKLLVCALRIAQGYVFSQVTGGRCIYLIDDLPAELDEEHRQKLAGWLNKMACQVFVTGVERDVLEKSWSELPDLKPKVFHVKHGQVTDVSD